MSYVIAAIDCETYDLGTRAALAEIGIVTVDIKSEGNYELLRDLLPVEFDRPLSADTFVVALPLLPQIIMGRTVSMDTLKFHQTILKEHNPDSEFGHTFWPIPPGQENWTLRQCLEEVKNFLVEKNVKEIWFNHTSFDCPRILSLAEEVGIDGPLWSFRIEFDIFTLRKYLKKVNPHAANFLSDSTKTLALHRAVPDAIWNLQELARAHALKDFHGLKDFQELKSFTGPQTDSETPP